jgi:hypothetical protein
MSLIVKKKKKKKKKKKTKDHINEIQYCEPTSEKDCMYLRAILVSRLAHILTSNNKERMQ